MPVRLIPRLDIKAPNLVKGVRLEGLRVIGDPAEHAARYYQEGADELLYVDVVASLYGSDASAVCDAFDGGLSTAGANRLRGNPGHGRRSNITTTAVTYAGLVIETYCPDVLPDFESSIEDIDPIEVTR